MNIQRWIGIVGLTAIYLVPIGLVVYQQVRYLIVGLFLDATIIDSWTVTNHKNDNSYFSEAMAVMPDATVRKIQVNRVRGPNITRLTEGSHVRLVLDPGRDRIAVRNGGKLETVGYILVGLIAFAVGVALVVWMFTAPPR